MDLKKLKEPFDPSLISWRVGATNIKDPRTGQLKWGDKPLGVPLAYIDARDVMERLDEVCGVENWQVKYSHANGKTIADIGIKINDEWIWKASGAGDTQVEAEKGAISDALKRAAVVWGIGRYLYDVRNFWIELEKKGGSWVIQNPKDSRLEGALQKAAAGIRLPSEPSPEDKSAEVVKQIADNLRKMATLKDPSEISAFLEENPIPHMSEAQVEYYDKKIKEITANLKEPA